MSDVNDGRKCKRLNTYIRTTPVYLIPGTQPTYWETAFFNKFYLVKRIPVQALSVYTYCYIYYIMWQGQRERGKFPLCLIRKHNKKTGTEWSGLQFLAEAWDLFLPQNVPTGCLVHPASYSMGTCSSFLSKADRKRSCPLTYSIWYLHYEWGGTIPLLPLYYFTVSIQTLPVWHL